MGGRYLISGTQLGMLIALDDQKEREKIIREVEDNQFLGDSRNHLLRDVKKAIKFNEGR